MKVKGKPLEADIQLGRELRRYRMKCMLTQDQVAQELGVTFQQVQKYERGANRISATKLVIVCEMFGITPNEILGFEEPRLSEIELEMIAQLRKIKNQSLLKSCLDIIRATARSKN